jgi:hypothetical protein
LKRLDYKDGEFNIRSRERVQKEGWMNAGLIYKENVFFDLLKNSKSTIWLNNFSNMRLGVS